MDTVAGMDDQQLPGMPPPWPLTVTRTGDSRAVAVHAGASLLPASWRRAGDSDRWPRVRWVVYVVLGLIGAATIGPWLVLVLLACGALEIAIRRQRRDTAGPAAIAPTPLLAIGALSAGTLASLIWVAFKVGALSYGGGFVIIPLMQNDAVNQYHWMTGGQFLNAVALGQITPGPVVQTVAVVGYAAAGLLGGVVAAVVAFSPSFIFVLVGARHFAQLRTNPTARAFLDGAGPAAIGAILGSAVALARVLTEPWQYAVLAVAAVALLVGRRGIVLTLLAAAVAGTVLVNAGLPIPH